MIPAASCCFQEDAACVIIDGEVVRRLASAGANGATEPCAGEPGEVNDLVLFLGRALLLTRRSLYVLLCLPAGAHTIPPPPFTNESQYGGRGPRVGDAATSVSCGMQIWHLIVLLNTRVSSLARRIGLASAPIIVPWNCEASRKQVSGAGLPPACTRWVERARAAVLRHYRLTVGSSAFWHSADEEGLVNAVPLVLDDDSTFSSRAACDLWPRHCHLGPLGGSVQVCPSKQALLFEVEEQDISGIQRSMRRNQGNDSGVAAHGTSQGFDEAVGRRDTAKADGKVEAQEPFQYTLAAGTFDRLHPGHQLLLAAAALSTRQTIGLAVASGPLIKKKTASQEDAAAAGVEPFACRLQAAAAFVQLVAASKGKSVQLTGLREAIEEEETSLSDELQLQTSLLDESNQISCGFMPVVEGSTSTVVDAFGGSLQLQVFRITDAVGPADRLSFDCLVVSAETVKGANMVNTFRVEAGNEPVFVLTVDLVPTDASVVHQPSQALAAYLPSPFLKGVHQFEQESGFPKLIADETASKLSIHCRSRVVAQEDGHTVAPQESQNSTAELVDTLGNKLSSTTLRQVQLKRLCCGSIAELCSRFQAAWLWLEGETGITERQACVTMWSSLCAEHAAPWRKLHTFDRLTRALKRLDALDTSARREPIVLSVFLGSLLACPCAYITLARCVCVASDSKKLANVDDANNSCTFVSWDPEAEDTAWQKSAAKLLLALQWKLRNRACAAAQTSELVTGKVSTSLAFASADILLRGRFSLIMGLLWEQRATTLTRLAPTMEAINALRARHSEPFDDTETAKLMRLARRLEQLEFADSSVEAATRLQKLRQEYFFVSEDYFSRYRRKQLAKLLECASSFDCLDHEELIRARANAERELHILESQSLHDGAVASAR